VADRGIPSDLEEGGKSQYGESRHGSIYRPTTGSDIRLSVGRHRTVVVRFVRRAFGRVGGPRCRAPPGGPKPQFARHRQRVLAESATLEEAATRLGINSTTLWRKRKRWGLD